MSISIEFPFLGVDIANKDIANDSVDRKFVRAGLFSSVVRSTSYEGRVTSRRRVENMERTASYRVGNIRVASGMKAGVRLTGFMSLGVTKNIIKWRNKL